MIAINLCLITRFILYNLTENRRVIIEVLGAYFIKLQNEKQDWAKESRAYNFDNFSPPPTHP